MNACFSRPFRSFILAELKPELSACQFARDLQQVIQNTPNSAESED